MGLLNWLQEKFVELQQFLYSLVLTLFDILKDIFFFIMESLFDLSILIVKGLDSLFSGLDLASYINALPPEVKFYASAIGLSEATAMIISAIAIRFLLQLIPFVRFGS